MSDVLPGADHEARRSAAMPAGMSLVGYIDSTGGLWNRWAASGRTMEALRPLYTPADNGDSSAWCHWAPRHGASAWTGTCGNSLAFQEAGGPDALGMRFCPYCGRPLRTRTSSLSAGEHDD